MLTQEQQAIADAAVFLIISAPVDQQVEVLKSILGRYVDSLIDGFPGITEDQLRENTAKLSSRDQEPHCRDRHGRVRGVRVMTHDDTVHVENVDEFRMLTPQGDPSYIILRVKTQAGEVHNFGFDRAAFTHVVRVWNFDLGALEAAVEGRAPHPGKPAGSPNRKAS